MIAEIYEYINCAASGVYVCFVDSDEEAYRYARSLKYHALSISRFYSFSLSLSRLLFVRFYYGIKYFTILLIEDAITELRVNVTIENVWVSSKY